MGPVKIQTDRRAFQCEREALHRPSFYISATSRARCGTRAIPSILRRGHDRDGAGEAAVSQRIRKRIEEAFGWAKTIAGLAKTKLRGTKRVAFKFTFIMAAYNLIRRPKLLAAA